MSRTDTLNREALAYRVGLPGPLRREAAVLYEEAFRQKFTPILGSQNKRVALLCASICPQYAIVALQGEKLVGVCGFHEGEQSFTGGGTIGDVLAQAGFLRGAWALFLLSLLERKPREGELLLDGIVVDAAARGRGVGTALLRRATAYAHELGLETVRLDVVDTNPAARRLYEREGFSATRTEKTPYLKRLMGFSASTTMVRGVTIEGV